MSGTRAELADKVRVLDDAQKSYLLGLLLKVTPDESAVTLVEQASHFVPAPRSGWGNT